jgi:hypothetical protein
MATYTESEFINLYDDPTAKLAQVRLILDALDTLQIELISKGMVKEYELNDGQVRIKKVYNSISDINKSRLAYEQLGNRLIEKTEGRLTRFIPC